MEQDGLQKRGERGGAAGASAKAQPKRGRKGR